MRWIRGLVLMLTYGSFAVSLAQPAEPEVQIAGSGTYLLTRPANTVAPPAEIQRTPGLHGPMPSNRWWTSLAWERWSQPVFADPLSARASFSGMRIGWPQLVIGERDFRAAHEDALVVGVPGRDASSSLVSDYSDWAVEVTFNDREDDSFMTSRLVKGSPYAWFEAPGGVITVQGGTAHGAARELSGQLVVTVRARGRTYAALAPAGSVHAWPEDDVLRIGDGSTPLRIALAPLPEDSAAHLELLAQNAFSEPGQTRTSWRWLRDEGVVEVTFHFGTDTPVLAGLYPHQWKRSDQELTGLSYATPRGELRVALTSGFTIRVPYQGAMPAMPPMQEPISTPVAHCSSRVEGFQPASSSAMSAAATP